MVSDKSIWYALTYYRLSKDDYIDRESGDTSDQRESQHYSSKESNSITNQRKLIQEFIAASEDIVFVEEFYNNGFSGGNFNRPGFQRLLRDINSGRINCVIVKDLSRFGRNFIETSEYLEKIFPLSGIQFVAVNNGYDNISDMSEKEGIVIPFSNMMNEMYLRDTSRKIRSSIDTLIDKGGWIMEAIKERKHRVMNDNAEPEFFEEELDTSIPVCCGN